jgi:dynein heavy chain
MFLNTYKDIPWEALRYMVAEANYGGRVTDPKDRRCINTILMDFYDQKILHEGYKLSESGVYTIPPEGDLVSMKEFINQTVPYNDLTEIFGFHSNADITSSINDTTILLSQVLSLMPRDTAGSSGKSQDQILTELASEILEKLPKDFDIERACKLHPIRHDDSMNTVLQ